MRAGACVRACEPGLPAPRRALSLETGRTMLAPAVCCLASPPPVPPLPTSPAAATACTACLYGRPACLPTELDAVHARIMGTRYGGEDAPMEVRWAGGWAGGRGRVVCLCVCGGGGGAAAGRLETWSDVPACACTCGMGGSCPALPLAAHSNAFAAPPSPLSRPGMCVFMYVCVQLPLGGPL